jgi:hypothetical protein
MITLIPGGGLANRMRAIDSAYNLALQHKKKLKVLWIKNKDLNCDFYTLFEKNDSFMVKEFSVFDFYAYPAFIQRKYPFIKKWVLKHRKAKFDVVILNEEIHKEIYKKNNDIKIPNNYKNLLINTCERFVNVESLDEIFKPTRAVLQLADVYTQKFNKSTIGLHIRRSDNSKAISSSPLSFFIEQIKIELKKSASTTFFLCTDDAATKILLKQMFGERIATRNINYNRNSKKDTIDAAVDFICLSRTNKIIGSAYSSFSYEAGVFGAISVLTPET